MADNLKWKLAQTLEIRWWKNYLKDKDVATYIEWKKDYWKDFLKNIPHLPKLENLNILDAGCGPAGIFTVLENNQVDAIDPLMDKYQNLEHFNAAWYPFVTFKNQSIEQLDIQKKYDVIFCLNAINHVENIDLAYQKLANALKENGLLIVSTDAHRNKLLHKIFKLLPGDVLHPHQYNLKEYEQFLENNHISVFPSVLIKKDFIFDYYLTYGKK